MSEKKQLGEEQLKNVSGGKYGADYDLPVNDGYTKEDNDLLVGKGVVYNNEAWRILEFLYANGANGVWGNSFSVKLKSLTSGNEIVIDSTVFNPIRSTAFNLQSDGAVWR